MRIIDPIAEKPILEAQVYLTVKEATRIKQQLEVLLSDPEAADHFHVGWDGNHDLSFSLVTPSKLASPNGYTALERQVLSGMQL